MASLMVMPASRADPPAGPANDDFADAIDITTIPFVDLHDGKVAYATIETAEPAGCSTSPAFSAPLLARGSIWYRVTPTSETFIGLRVHGPRGIEVGAYTGTSVSNLKEIACSADGGGDTTLNLRVEAGEAYHLRVAFEIELGARAALFSALPSAMPMQGSITGRVTNDDGKPLPDVCVYHSPSSRVRTDAQGRYRVWRGPGTHELLFDDCRSNREYSFEYYNDQISAAHAETLLLPPMGSIDRIDAELSQVASLGGRVVAEDTGDPLGSVCVFVAIEGSWGWQNTEEAGFAPWPGTVTREDGYFSLILPSERDYRLQFADCDDDREPHSYVTEYFDDEPTFESAQRIHVDPGEVRLDLVVTLAPTTA